MTLATLRTLGVALLLTSASSVASAQTVTERLRLQGGYLTQANPAPQPRFDDAFIGAVPELSVYWSTPRSLFSMTYQLTGALHTLGGASEIANRLTLASLFDLTSRTTLLLSVEASQTTFSNFLIQRPATDSTIALYPGPSNRILTARALQGINYELSPRWRLEQSADVGVVTTIAPAPPLDTFLGNIGGAVERVWRNDAVGIEARGGYVRTLVLPPTPDQEFITLTGAPRWRRDWSRAVSTSLSGGASVVLSPRTPADPLFAPFARAAALYTVDAATFELSYATGVFPSPLTGQVIRSHQVTVRGFTPISQHHGVFVGASVGYLDGSIVDLVNPANDRAFDTILSDIDLSWQATRCASVFARYQFVAQIADVNPLGLNPSFLRDLFLVGVQFSSRPTGGDLVPTRFPQRVDGGDQRAVSGQKSAVSSPK